MLTAMTAVDNIIAGVTDKSNIWAVNTEEEYHEAKSNMQSLPETQTSEKALNPAEERSTP